MSVSFLRLFGSNGVADILIEREERVKGRGAVDSTVRKWKLLLPPMCILEALKPPPAMHYTNYHNQEHKLAPRQLTYALDTCEYSIAFWRWSEKAPSQTGTAFVCSDSMTVKYIKH